MRTLSHSTLQRLLPALFFLPQALTQKPQDNLQKLQESCSAARCRKTKLTQCCLLAFSFCSQCCFCKLFISCFIHVSAALKLTLLPGFPSQLPMEWGTCPSGGSRSYRKGAGREATQGRRPTRLCPCFRSPSTKKSSTGPPHNS